MRLDTLFHLSFYVTLGLAACCLALAETFFLPWLGLCLPVLFGVFVLAWRKEGVWVLGETAANYLGIVIALTAAGWILLRMPQTEEQMLASGVPWPAGLLPQLAPVLLLLLVVKLFRPKRLADFWVIQTIGLMMITLGCVLAYQEAFGLLLLAYVAALLWCLMLFHFYREERFTAATRSTLPLFEPAGPVPAEAEATSAPWHLLGVSAVVCWLGLIVLTALPLFLIMPRSTAAQWVPQKLSSSAPRPRTMQTGIEPGIDLFRVGHIEPSREEAFTVSVHDSAGKPAALPSGMYWRTDVLDFYQRGRWQNWRQIEEFRGLKGRKLPTAAPATLPADQSAKELVLRYSMRPIRAGDLVLAEPVEIVVNEKELREIAGSDPHVGDRGSKVDLFHAREGTDSLMSFVLMPKQIYSYGQKLRLPESSETIPVTDVSEDYRNSLLEMPVPEDITAWTREVIKFQPSLRPGDREYDSDTENRRLLPQHHAKVARVLTKYLSSSGLFRYSLDLRRKDYNADPTSDFLLNTKQGHCERYASGLALMLRGLGIPARVVKGYRGVEQKKGADEEESDKSSDYLVRQAQAHSWVQALVLEEGRWVWLVLDPTPELQESKTDSFSLLTWLGQSLKDGRYFWYNFILEYNTEVQTASVRSLFYEALQGFRWAGRYATWATPPLLLFWVVWYGRRLFHRAARTPAPATGQVAAPLFYVQFLRVLGEQFHVAPASGETPLEFSRQAAKVLRRDTRTMAWDLLPARVADALYRQSYGGEPLGEAEQSALTAQVNALERAVQAGVAPT
jgi:hypothetical protein